MLWTSSSWQHESVTMWNEKKWFMEISLHKFSFNFLLVSVRCEILLLVLLQGCSLREKNGFVFCLLYRRFSLWCWKRQWECRCFGSLIYYYYSLFFFLIVVMLLSLHFVVKKSSEATFLISAIAILLATFLTLVNQSESCECVH